MASVVWLVVAVLVIWLATRMTVSLVGLFSGVLIGALAGWLAGKFIQGKGFGLLKNILVGIIGALVGGLLFPLFGLHAVGLIGSLVTDTAGAIVLLTFVRWLQAS
jgi:uncharacterized membrane protein YeaQ/YmgE (transglycosylase-associated protein family)